jgi:hypothetical protein
VAGILHNLGIAHGALNDDPTHADDGAQDFLADGQRYNLTDETAGANNLPGFAQVKSLTNNPLTNRA